MSGIDAKSPKPGMRIKGKFGVYELVKKIGSGGNGTVFAIEVISDRKGLPEREDFVIKILTVRPNSEREREKRERRFYKEIRYVYQLQREIDGIIPIYDSSCFLEEKSDYAWYIMPKAERYNFKKIFSVEEKLRNMRDIGVCIAQLHVRNFVHRDIKPQNLLVYKNRVCLSDFGLVRNMEEAEEHITDMHDNMGPIIIRPPEMQSIENLDKIDYKKSDVYLFAKTIWIILTGQKEGFTDEYSRSIKRIYLDKNELQVETAEPLHVMLESATKHYWWDRLDIGECIQYMDDQLNVITKRASDVDLGRWKYDEMVKEISETIVADVQIYQGTYSVQKVLERMTGIINLIFEEAEKAYNPMFLKGVKILPDNLFELDVKTMYYHNRRKIVIDIEKISVEKNLSCVIYTKVIASQPNKIPLYTNLNKALESMEKQICISGIYSIRFGQMGTFC